MLLCHMEYSYVAQPLQLRNTTMSQSRTDSESPIHDVWLRVKDISLINDDRKILETEEMLIAR